MCANHVSVCEQPPQARLHVRTGAVDKALHSLSALLGALRAEGVVLTQGRRPTEEEQHTLHLMVGLAKSMQCSSRCMQIYNTPT